MTTLVILYFDVVIRAVLHPMDSVECEAMIARRGADIAAFWAADGFDPDGIELRCVAPRDLVLKEGRRA